MSEDVTWRDLASPGAARRGQAWRGEAWSFLICTRHQIRVDVRDTEVLHHIDGHGCDAAHLVDLRGRVTTPAQVRAALPPLPGDDEPEGVPA